MNRSRIGRPCLILAMLLAFAHAAISFYWATGGSWGIETIGQWAIDSRTSHPLLITAALIALGMVKVAAGVIPYIASIGRFFWRTFWRTISAAGSLVLIAWGGANVVVGGAALLGLVAGPETAENRHALMMHVFLWDMVFLLWGIFLLVGLWATSPRRNRRRITAPDPGIAPALNN